MHRSSRQAFPVDTWQSRKPLEENHLRTVHVAILSYFNAVLLSYLVLEVPGQKIQSDELVNPFNNQHIKTVRRCQKLDLRGIKLESNGTVLILQDLTRTGQAPLVNSSKVISEHGRHGINLQTASSSRRKKRELVISVKLKRFAMPGQLGKEQFAPRPFLLQRMDCLPGSLNKVKTTLFGK